MYIYYPSCNFQKLFPDTAKKIRAYMNTQPDVKVAGCCHVTNSLPQEGDIIVTVCMSCMHILDEVRADIPGISLFEFLLTRKDFPWPDFTGREMTLQDCFRARGKHGLQDAVRECLKNMHVSYVEMEHNRDEEEFDGSFRLHDPFPNNMKEAPAYYAQYLPAYVTPLPKEEWQGYYEEQAKKYTTDEVVGYCNTCVTGAQEGLLASARADARDEARAQARDGGAKAWHLAQLIFG